MTHPLISFLLHCHHSSSCFYYHFPDLYQWVVGLRFYLVSLLQLSLPQNKAIYNLSYIRLLISFLGTAWSKLILGQNTMILHHLQDKIQSFRIKSKGLTLKDFFNLFFFPKLSSFPFLPYVRHESLQPTPLPIWGAPTHPSSPLEDVASSRKASRMPVAWINSTCCCC